LRSVRSNRVETSFSEALKGCFMRNLRTYGFLAIPAHWIVAVWHLVLVAKVLPASDNSVHWLAIALLTLVHGGVLLACWKLTDRFAGLTLCVFLLVALGSGIYEHFLGPGLNNVFRMASSDWTTAFRASVFLLAVVEILGCWFGIQLASKNRERRIKVAH
jgi:hypothetical protein